MADEYSAGEKQRLDAGAVARWNEWVASRPAAVRAIAEKVEPWRAYRIKSTGNGCRIYSIGEHADGTASITVAVTRDLNPQGLVFERTVFGLQLDDLEPMPDSGAGRA